MFYNKMKDQIIEPNKTETNNSKVLQNCEQKKQSRQSKKHLHHTAK